MEVINEEVVLTRSLSMKIPFCSNDSGDDGRGATDVDQQGHQHVED